MPSKAINSTEQGHEEQGSLSHTGGRAQAALSGYPGYYQDMDDASSELRQHLEPVSDSVRGMVSLLKEPN
jgi:hypothetical protein